MNISQTTGPVKSARPLKAKVPEENAEGRTITVDLSTIGEKFSSGLRIGAGALSVGLHAPHVVVGPLFTQRASGRIAAANAGDGGYVVANGVGVGAAAGLATHLLGGDLLSTAIATVAAGGVASIITGGILSSTNTTNSAAWGLTSVSEKKREAFNSFAGSIAAKKGKAFKAGFQEAGRFYFEKGARTVEGLGDFIHGFSS